MTELRIVVDSPTTPAAAADPLDAFNTLELLTLTKLVTMLNALDVRHDVVARAARELTELERGVLVAFDLNFETAQIPADRRALMLTYLESGEPLMKIKGYTRPM